jgi:hypothetical protein
MKTYLTTFSKQEKPMDRNTNLISTYTGRAILFMALAVLSLGGCTRPKESAPRATQDAKENDHKEASGVPAQPSEDDDIKAVRAKLSPEDQSLVAAQEFCVISSDERLGSMGPPVKIMVKDQPVFLCCKGCQKKALANPEQTLAKIDELKAKVKAGADK